jgi:UDP-N-acetylmuramoylalanine-D-glutamate ligase
MKVLVLGAGVSGLAAIQTAKNMGEDVTPWCDTVTSCMTHLSKRQEHA